MEACTMHIFWGHAVKMLKIFPVTLFFSDNYFKKSNTLEGNLDSRQINTIGDTYVYLFFHFLISQKRSRTGIVKYLLHFWVPPWAELWEWQGWLSKLMPPNSVLTGVLLLFLVFLESLHYHLFLNSAQGSSLPHYVVRDGYSFISSDFFYYNKFKIIELEDFGISILSFTLVVIVIGQENYQFTLEYSRLLIRHSLGESSELGVTNFGFESDLCDLCWSMLGKSRNLWESQICGTFG